MLGWSRRRISRCILHTDHKIHMLFRFGLACSTLEQQLFDTAEHHPGLFSIIRFSIHCFSEDVHRSAATLRAAATTATISAKICAATSVGSPL